VPQPKLCFLSSSSILPSNSLLFDLLNDLNKDVFGGSESCGGFPLYIDTSYDRVEYVNSSRLEKIRGLLFVLLCFSAGFECGKATGFFFFFGWVREAGMW
jgi:hypothetical protein